MQQRLVRASSSSMLVLSNKNHYIYRNFCASNPFADIEEMVLEKTASSKTASIHDKKDEVYVWNTGNNNVKTHTVYNTDINHKVAVFSFNDKLAYSLHLPNKSKNPGEILNLDNEEKLTVPFIENSQNNVLSFNTLNDKKDAYPQNNLELLTKSRLINPDEKRLPEFQVRTGYIPVDYTNPIAEGSFCTFYGKYGTGKFDLIKSTIVKFQQENENSVAVYFSLNKKEAYHLQNFFETNEIDSEKYVIFCPDIETSNVDKFLTGQCALKYTTTYRDLGKKVIFCMKDIFEYYISVSSIYRAMNIAKPDINLFYELASQSYCVSSGKFQNGSITSILSVIEDEVAEYYAKDRMDLSNMLLSQSNVVVEFDLEDKRFRGIKPLVGLKFQDSALNCQWFVQRAQINRLSDLVVKLQNQRESFQLQTELKIHIDPWDYFLVYDSNYWLKFMINTRTYSYYEQLLLVHFVVKSVEEDIISYFEEDPKIVTEKYFKFIEEFKNFNETSIIEWLKFIRDNKLEDHEEHHIFDNLDRVFHMFFLDQKDKGFLLKYKKDYFN